MKSQFVNKIINNLKDIIKDHESDIRCDFKFRNQIPWNGYGEPHSSEEYKIAERAIIRKWIKDLREAKEALDGIKKQMPMPVKTHKGCAKCVCSGNGRAYLYNYHNYYCQNCNGLILHDMPDYPKYCPCCGQKLWWRK